MEREKVLIVGANGFLGRRLLQRFKEKFSVVGADIDISGINKNFNPVRIDITQSESVKDVFNKIKPNLTILTAAMTNVDACEDFPEKAKKLNADGPLYIAEAVKSVGGRLIHISTDFIFDGLKGNYLETDEPYPISVYGQTKLQGEKNVLQQDILALICRTSVLYGWPSKGQHENFFTWAYKQLKNENPIKIIDGQITTPTLVDDLAEFLYQVSNFSQQKILHTTGPEALTRYEFVKKIVNVFGFNKNLLNKIGSFSQKAKRPDNSSLNTIKIQHLGKYQFRNINQSFQFLKLQKSKIKNQKKKNQKSKKKP